VGVCAALGEEGGVLVTKKTQKGTFVTCTHKRKGVRRVVAAIGKDVGGYRPDLAQCAMAAAASAHAAGRRAGESVDDE
jgi:hypothetical protein